MSVQAGDDLRITAVMTAGVNTTAMNVFDFRVTGTGTVDDSDMMTDFEAFMSDAYAELTGIMSNQAAPVEIRGYNVSQDVPLPTVPWTTWTGPGSATSILPHGVCGFVLFRTGVSKLLGRKFLPFFSEDRVNNGVWDATAMVAMVAWAIEIMASEVGAATGFTIEYRVRSKLNAMHPPVSATVANLPGYQRRRKPGRGM